MNKKTRITNPRNVVFSCAVIVLSVAGILQTFWGTWSKNTGEAAKMFPRIVYIILIVVSLYLLIKELLEKEMPEPPALTSLKLWQVPAVFTASAVFFLFCIHIGTGTAILLFLILMIWMFDEDFKANWKKDLLVAVFATVVLWLIFTKVLPIITMHQYLI